jgi:flagellar motor protein MotB
MRRIAIAAGALCVLVVASGCAGKTKERLNVALAENADLTQRVEQQDQEFQRVQAENDRAMQDVQRAQQQLAIAQSNAEKNALYQGQAVELQRQLSVAENRQIELQERLNKQLAAARPVDVRPVESSPQLAAFRADLQQRLNQYGVKGVDVELRTSKAGETRVAIVLQNSFRPGNASLSSNVSAVKAVVGVGKLISESYRGSRVVVEGHTDADPIKKSKWDSNEALSLARAEEVRKLLRQSGVPDGRITAEGMGARNSVARGTTDRAKAQNRRVEIYIYPAS